MGVLSGVQRVPVSCLVTLVEGKGMSCPASWVTLQALVWNDVIFQRKYMEHTDDPGRENHQELDLGR